MQHVYCFHCVSPSCLILWEQDQKQKLDPPDCTAKSQINKDSSLSLFFFLFFPLNFEITAAAPPVHACIISFFIILDATLERKKKREEERNPGLLARICHVYNLIDLHLNKSLILLYSTPDMKRQQIMGGCGPPWEAREQIKRPATRGTKAVF